jgi:DNA-binding response OmpR family regulator
MKILVVEDDPVICRTIQATFNCDCATDGWDAIEKLETSDYAAIIIDTDIARHSGYGVLTYLREESGEALTNVIVMTSSDREAMRKRVGDDLRVVDKCDAVGEITRMIRSAPEESLPR